MRGRGDGLLHGRNRIDFDAAAAQRLFHNFLRLSNARDCAGTGVGLSVVRRTVTRHGGRAWAQGEPGRGARFFCKGRTAPAELDACQRAGTRPH